MDSSLKTPQLEVVLLLFTNIRRNFSRECTHMEALRINNPGFYFEKGIRFSQDFNTGQKSGTPIARLKMAGSKLAPSAPQDAPISPIIPAKKKNPPTSLLARDVLFTPSLN